MKFEIGKKMKINMIVSNGGDRKDIDFIAINNSDFESGGGICLAKDKETADFIIQALNDFYKNNEVLSK